MELRRFQQLNEPHGTPQDTRTSNRRRRSLSTSQWETPFSLKVCSIHTRPLKASESRTLASQDNRQILYMHHNKTLRLSSPFRHRSRALHRLPRKDKHNNHSLPQTSHFSSPKLRSKPPSTPTLMYKHQCSSLRHHFSRSNNQSFSSRKPSKTNSSLHTSLRPSPSSSRRATSSPSRPVRASSNLPLNKIVAAVAVSLHHRQRASLLL